MDNTDLILLVFAGLWFLVEAFGWMIGTSEEYPYDDEM